MSVLSLYEACGSYARWEPTNSTKGGGKQMLERRCAKEWELWTGGCFVEKAAFEDLEE